MSALVCTRTYLSSFARFRIRNVCFSVLFLLHSLSCVRYVFLGVHVYVVCMFLPFDVY